MEFPSFFGKIDHNVVILVQFVPTDAAHVTTKGFRKLFCWPVFLHVSNDVVSHPLIVDLVFRLFRAQDLHVLHDRRKGGHGTLL